MKSLFAILLVSLSVSVAFSMPCDTGYKCLSASGKYQIELQRCRYSNNLGLIQVLIDGKSINGTLGASFDGEKVLAFEILIPTNSSLGEPDSRRLNVEMIDRAGTIKEQLQDYNPGSWRDSFSESISCQIEE